MFWLINKKINFLVHTEYKHTFWILGENEHQIWNSYLKEYRRYAPDSMQFLETRSEVKFKVTFTQLCYVTLLHPKIHPHTKFEIPTSNNMRYAPDMVILDFNTDQDP